MIAFKNACLIPPVFAASCLCAHNALALEGDWELGAAPAAWIQPARQIYGGGAELFAHYAVTDGLQLSFGAAAYGAKNTEWNEALGVYSLRLGLTYALDILQWVPALGVHVSSLFSENTRYDFHRNGHGMAVDFDISVQYRGFRHIGLGIFFGYHLVFVDADYMTAGLQISYHSGDF